MFNFYCKPLAKAFDSFEVKEVLHNYVKILQITNLIKAKINPQEYK